MALRALLSKENIHKLKFTYPHNPGKTPLSDPPGNMKRTFLSVYSWCQVTFGLSAKRVGLSFSFSIVLY